MITEGTSRSFGTLGIEHHTPPKAPLSWRLRNWMRPGFVKGLLGVSLAKTFSKLTGVMTATSELSIRLRRADGTWVDYGVVSRRLVTDAFVAMVVDDLDNGAADISSFNYHGVGTGTNAEAAGDTALQTESTTILTVDSTRATGTRSQPAANQYRTVGVISFDGSGAITEHGVLTQAATGGGTLMDRSVFAAINVASGDSITATYTYTLNSGG